MLEVLFLLSLGLIILVSYRPTGIIIYSLLKRIQNFFYAKILSKFKFFK